MKKVDVVRTILDDRLHQSAQKEYVQTFAPSNIALCKYWGKRNQEINLPMTSSLSISLGDKGCVTELRVISEPNDSIVLNNQSIDLFSAFGKRLVDFLNLFRRHGEPHFAISIQSNIPVAAGMASSACGFAAIVQALNDLFDWKLQPHEASILARLGSGSACRSLWQGFVEWHAGVREDGMDSHGQHIDSIWPELCLGLLVVSDKPKTIGSREAMQRTVSTSSLYTCWPHKVSRDLASLKQAIAVRDFMLLGKTAESNAMAMHATMLDAWPPITYFLPETLTAMQKIWQLRREGLSVYFTQDAGPNLKLLFLEKDISAVTEHFPTVEVLRLFR